MHATGPDQPVLVSADAGRLQQVAANLLTNAVEFTPSGGHVDVGVTSDGQRAVLVVRDTGEGITAAFLPHVFARFRQADGTVARRYGGLGLGLSIVASLARLHGGDVRAESPGPGQGSTFTVTLPLADASVLPEPVAAPAQAPAPGTGALAGVRILVVDDDEDVRTLVSTMLERAGAEVRSLDSGLAVQYTLTRMQPHVLVIDIGLPEEDGYSLAARRAGLTRVPT
ncbi:MAG: hybrid sensor histidine kinase/response regulator [Vicinamibacterales bacterium]